MVAPPPPTGSTGFFDLSGMDEWAFDLGSDLELPDPLESLPLEDFPLAFDQSDLPLLDLPPVASSDGDSITHDPHFDFLLGGDAVHGGASSTDLDEEEHSNDRSLRDGLGMVDKGSVVQDVRGGETSAVWQQSNRQKRVCLETHSSGTAAQVHFALGRPSSSSNTGKVGRVSLQHACASQGSQGNGNAICGEGREDPRFDGKERDEVSVKKQLRRIRNRESASESRQRRKLYVKDLEVKCRHLESECSQLQQQVGLTCTENIVLKEEIARLKKMNGSNGVAEPAVLLKDSLPLEFLSHLTCLCLLVEVFRVAGLYLGLFLLIAHQFLWRSNLRQNSWASEEAGSTSYNHTNDGSSNYTALFTRRKRSFSFWRRRWRYNCSTSQIAL